MIQSQIKPSDVESSVQLAQPCSNDEPTSVTVIMSSDSNGDNNFSDIQLTSDIYGQSVQVLNDSNPDIFDNCSPQDNASSNLAPGSRSASFLHKFVNTLREQACYSWGLLCTTW